VTHSNTWYYFSGQEIGPSQRPIPDITHHSQQTYINAPGGNRNGNPSKQAAADRTAMDIVLVDPLLYSFPS